MDCNLLYTKKVDGNICKYTKLLLKNCFLGEIVNTVVILCSLILFIIICLMAIYIFEVKHEKLRFHGKLISVLGLFNRLSLKADMILIYVVEF